MTDPLSVNDADFRRVCQLVSHDLRNPLAAIVTNLEFARRMLEQIQVDPDLAEAVRDSVTACDVLRRIVANFDVLAKSPHLKVTMHDVELSEVAREVSSRCEARASQASLRLVLDAREATILLTDRTLVALAIENLIANSLQHAPAGTDVNIALEVLDSGASITVRDEGPAIDPSLGPLALAVEGHTTTGRRDGTRYGRGLGLLTARIAIEAVGGSLAVSDDGGPSLMRLTVPRLR